MPLYSRSETDEQSEIVLTTTVKDSVDKYTSDNGLSYDGTSTVSGAQGYETAARRVVFIDDVEATLIENKERGLTAPGWWEYMTYTDSSGRTRHKAQHLVAFKDAPVNTPDLDDAVAADAVPGGFTPNRVIDYEFDSNAYYYNSDPVITCLALEATAPGVPNTGLVNFQWQKKSANGRWVNISDGGDYTIVTSYVDNAPLGDGPNGANDYYSSVLTISDPGPTGNGDKYRVKLTSENGAQEVITNECVLVYD